MLRALRNTRRLAVVGISLAGALLLVSSAVAQEVKPRPEPTMIIRGIGQYSIKPDFAVVAVRTVTTGDTLEEAAQAHPERVTRALQALDALKSEGVEVRESTFRLVQDNPVPRSGSVERPRFHATTAFRLKLQHLDRINPLLTRIGDTGLFELQRVEYKAVDERGALNQARRRAVVDAQGQAELYAEAAKVKLLDIVEISDGEARPGIQGAADMPAPRFVQIIPPTEITFDSSVVITWRIRSRP